MTKKTTLGCLYGIVATFIQLPVWLYLVYHVLSQVKTPAFVWVLFGVYVFSNYTLVFITEILKRVINKEMLDIAGGKDLK